MAASNGDDAEQITLGGDYVNDKRQDILERELPDGHLADSKAELERDAKDHAADDAIETLRDAAEDGQLAGLEVPPIDETFQADGQSERWCRFCGCRITVTVEGRELGHNRVFNAKRFRVHWAECPYACEVEQ